MSVNIMMLIMMYPVMLIVCFVMYTSTKPKSGMAFGCTVSAERMKDETLKEIERQWKHEMKRNICITALLPVLAFFVPYSSIQITIWTLWCFVLMALLEVPFMKANAKVKEVKRSMGWYDKENPESYVELKAAGEVRRVKTGAFLAPFGVSVLAAAVVYALSFWENGPVKKADYVREFGIIIILFAFLNIILWLTARWMDGQKTEVISSRSDINVNFARAKKNIWKDYWLLSSWLSTAFVWVCAVSLILDVRFDLAVLAGGVVYSLVLIGLLFPVLKKLKEVEAAYENERDIVIDSDDDKYWIWGTFYYNSSDKHTMVSLRNGLGTTVNMATKAGKVWWSVMVLVLLMVPVMCGWLIFEEFTPISLSIKGDEVQAEHLRVEYELQVAEITNLELVEVLPKMTKSVGSAMDNVAKGTFRIKETGEKCILFLNPQNEKFLRFEVDGQCYYMSGLTDEETVSIYQYLAEKKK